jgi:hypothetical protein
MINIAKALNSLKPTAEFSIQNGVINWISTEVQQPTESEIQAEIIRLQEEYNTKQYQRDRAAEYPAITDQLDKIFHEGLDAWKADIQAIKDKYPKG